MDPKAINDQFHDLADRVDGARTHPVFLIPDLLDNAKFIDPAMSKQAAWMSSPNFSFQVTFDHRTE